jgi:hypothetical protein
LFKLQAKALVVDAELNAICDFILEAGEWAAELAAVPLEQRQISRFFSTFFSLFFYLIYNLGAR